MITCGIFLYSIIKNKILICHPTNSSWKKWSIPKGRPNEKEYNFNAAIRELKEETGLKIKNLNVLKTYPLPIVKYKKKTKILVSYLVIINNDLTHHSFSCTSYTEDNIPEVDKWKWISVDQIDEFLHESQKKNLNVIKKILKTIGT